MVHIAVTVEELEIIITAKAQEAMQEINKFRSQLQAMANEMTKTIQSPSVAESMKKVGPAAAEAAKKTSEAVKKMESDYGDLDAIVKRAADRIASVSSKMINPSTSLSNKLKSQSLFDRLQNFELSASGRQKSLGMNQMGLASALQKSLDISQKELSSVQLSGNQPSVTPLDGLKQFLDDNGPSIANMAQNVAQATVKMKEPMQQVAKGIQTVQNRMVNATKSTKTYGKQVQQTVSQAKGMFNGLGRVIRRVIVTGVLYKGFAKLFSFIGEGIQNAIAAPETENLFRVALGRMADDAEAFAVQLKNALGIDEYATKEMIGTFQNMITSMNVSSNTAYRMSKSLTLLANDMASLYNISEDQAFENLQSALTGQGRAVRKYGYVVTEQTTKEAAWRHGLVAQGQELNEQQKVIARYLVLLEQSGNAQGDMARTLKNTQNQIRLLKQNVIAAGRSVGTAFLPFIQACLPWLNAFAIVIQRVGITLSKFTYSLFGMNYDEEMKKQKQQIDSVGTLTGAEDKLGTAIDKAGKKAKGALASFDELHVLQQNTADDIETGDVGEYDVPDIPELAVPEGKSPFDGYVNKIQGFFEKFIYPLRGIDFGPAIEAFGRLREAISPFTQTLFAGLRWGYDNIFVPLAKFTIEEVLPRYFDTLAIAYKALTVVLGEGIETFKIWKKVFLDPIAKFAGEKLISFWDKFNEKISEFVDEISKSEIFEDFRDILEAIGPILANIVQKLIALGSFVLDLTWTQGLVTAKNLFHDLENAIGLVSDILKGDFSGALEHLKDLLIGNKIEAAKERFKELGESILGATGILKDAIEPIDLFADDISDATKNKVEPFLGQMRKFDNLVVKIDYTGAVIDQKTYDDAINRIKSIKNTIIAELDSDKNQELQTLDTLKKALGDEAYNSILESQNNYYDKAQSSVLEGEERIRKIMAEASKQKRTLTAKEKEEINQIQQSMAQTGVKAMSDSEVEYQTIMRRMKDNSVRVSTEQASEIIQNAIKTRDETINNAEQQYTRQVEEAKKMYESGKINKDQYSQIISAAEKTRVETVNKANDQYDKINQATKEKLGENAKYIDEDTGKIKSKWQVFCDGLSSRWGKMWGDIKSKFSDFGASFKEKWNSLWKGVGNLFITIWNGIVHGFESAINFFVWGLNHLKISIPDWEIFGGLAGKSFGVNLQKVHFDPIPKLESGAALTSPTYAMIAEYPGAKTNPEIVSPQNLMQETFVASVYPLIDAVLEGTNNVVQAINNKESDVYLDGDSVARKLRDPLNRLNRRIGSEIVQF